MAREELNAKARADALLGEFNTDYATLKEEHDSLIQVHDEQTQQLVATRNQLSGAAAETARVQKMYDDHMKTHVTPEPEPEPEPVPVPHKTLFGAGGGNSNRVGTGIKVDRRYYGSGDRGAMLTATKTNDAANIVSWPTFKFPFSWAEMADGKGDSWADTIYRDYKALPRPQGMRRPLGFHHEPENDGDIKLWTAIQDRLSRRCPEELEFWIVVTGWHQHNTPAFSWDNIFPKGAPVYGIAYDYPYNQYGFEWVNGAKTTTMNNNWFEAKGYVDRVADEAKRLGVKAAIAEAGFSDEAFAKDKTWLDRFFADCERRELEYMTYFDTKLNSKRSWWLGPADSAKRAHFRKLLDAR